MQKRNIRIIIYLLIFASILFYMKYSSPLNDKLIIHHILKKKFPDGGYAVVSPVTANINKYLLKSSPINQEEVEKAIDSLNEQFETKGFKIKNLIRKLIERNSKSTKLPLQSSIQSGYFIDTEKKFSRYFASHGGGWDLWYKENPTAHGSTSISMPVFDTISGLVLIYYGHQSHYLSGSGEIKLFLALRRKVWI